MKMNFSFLFLLLIQLALCQDNNTKDEVREILEFLHRGEEKIKSAEHNEIIYVVGNTGTGKSTLVHFLAGKPHFLRSISSDEYSDDFIIEQVSGEKIGTVTFQSQTIYPDLIIDENNVHYYDCPGFSDTRNTSIEIATTYFTKKAINYAERLKIVFVVNYNSMLKGFSSRKDFADFVQHATEFLKDVNHYKSGITLVTSKVQSGQDDEKLMRKVRSFLKEYRTFIVGEAERTNLTNSKQQLDLIDIFLSNERISLFKRPSTSGLLSQIPEMMKNREELLHSVNSKIKFVEKNEEHFGYTLSDRSKLKINALAEEINRKITNIFELISRSVKDHYSSKYVNFNDMANLKDEFDNVINILSKISSKSGVSAVAISKLNVPNIQRNFVDIKNHMEYLQFLESVNDKPITKRTTEWAVALQSSIDFLVKEKNWYSFADTLFHRLSEFDVQGNTSKYDVADVERWGEGDAESGITITKENFQVFLKKLMAFELAENIEASTSKIDLLNEILNSTVKCRPSYTCQNDKMTVKGIFVKFSDLQNYETICGETVQLIEVFALSTIFFDLDFKRNVDLVVIAPKWHIMEKHIRITLDGADGVDGGDVSIHGNEFFNGKPGMCGQNAHHFFGYGDELVNIENLYITAVGGNGGRGQNGFHGLDGHEITVPKEGTDGAEYLGKYVELMKRTDDSDIGFLYFNRKSWEHETFQSHANCPSINGIGGSGGFGGYGGTIELNGMKGVKTLIKDGSMGPHGLPGKCGKAYDKVFLYKTKSTSCIFWFFCTNKITWNSRRNSDEECAKSCRDSALVNGIGISKPKANNRRSSAFSVDQYKSFVRENLHGFQMNAKLLSNFLQSMEQNLEIRATYDTAAFIHDFYQLEKEYRGLKNRDDSLYFYTSLIERILEYTSNRSKELQVNERRILANLYTAGLSKICKIRSGTEQSLIVDIASYLDVAIEHIRLVEKTGKQVALNKFKNEYRDSLEAEISDNHNVISMNIMPEIENLNLQIGSLFDNLLDKVIGEKKSFTFNTVRYNKMKKKLEKSIVPREILKFLKNIAGIVSLFSGFGTVLGKTINAVEHIAYAFTYDQGNQKPSGKISFTIPDEMNDRYHQLENSARSTKNEKFKSLVSITDEILNMATNFSYNDILKPLKKLKGKMMSGKTVDLSSNEIDLLQNDVQTIVEKEIVKVKTQSRNETESLKALEKLNRKLSVLHLDVEIFNKFRSNDEKLKEIDSAIKQSKTELLELKNLEQNLHMIVNPIMSHMRTLLKKLQTKVNDDKVSSLEALLWHIQNMLKDVRYRMQQFGGDNSKFIGELSHTFDKLDGTISILSNIYHRIQIYEDQAKLSNYIANIESTDFTGENLSTHDTDNLNRLNHIIQSNILLTIFDNALNGFKQTVFPFADFYLRRFNIPPQLETETNLKELVKKATDELMNLKLTLKEHHSASINPNDNIIHTADFSSGFLSSQPFYVWTGDEHKDVITKILSGHNVTMKADIEKGLKLNAVKFQYLEIHLKCSDPTKQATLDKYLENFDVHIIHHGNSYYRCNDKFYLITSPTQCIEYSFEKDSNGHSIRSNNVYRKMRTGDFVLSPYALLTISLTARHSEQFQIFNDFGQTIDLELIGRGQYLNPNIDACLGLDKYYG